jgi:hypothetical protein
MITGITGFWLIRVLPGIRRRVLFEIPCGDGRLRFCIPFCILFVLAVVVYY